MTSILCFSRNRCTSVEQIDENTMRSSCHLQDSLMDALVEIAVKLPDLEITGIKAGVRRSRMGVDPEGINALQKAVGVRVGPGMLKIIKGLIGGEGDLQELAFMVEECCHGVILSFTKEELLKTPQEEEAAREHFAGLVRENIRLYNRCAAFAAGSSFVEGIEPPKGMSEAE